VLFESRCYVWCEIAGNGGLEGIGEVEGPHAANLSAIIPVAAMTDEETWQAILVVWKVFIITFMRMEGDEDVPHECTSQGGLRPCQHYSLHVYYIAFYIVVRCIRSFDCSNSFLFVYVDIARFSFRLSSDSIVLLSLRD
jgi:hypothetical protein